MPGVDLLDAFAELVVCVVFNLPHDEPPPPSSSCSSGGDDDDSEDSPAGANSSSSTQIFSRVNSAVESQSHAPLQLSPSTREVAAFTAVNMARSAPSRMSEASSTQSLDLYPGGFWNPMGRMASPQSEPPAAAGVVAAAAAAAANGSHSHASPYSHPSSDASFNTGDMSTPRSSALGTDRSAGFWSRLLGSSGAVQTPPRSSSYGQFPYTGVSTNASSYVQLTEEDLGMANASGQAGGGTSGWTYVSTPPSFTQYSSQPQVFEWNGGDSRGAPTPLSLSTPLTEASPSASVTQLPPSQLPPSQVQVPPSTSTTQQQQQQQHLRLNPHGLYIAGRRSNSPQEGQSQASSNSEFVVL
ncbi:hypothetical protein N2W54_002971 [Lotmaria passim]